MDCKWVLRLVSVSTSAAVLASFKVDMLMFMSDISATLLALLIILAACTSEPCEHCVTQTLGNYEPHQY